MRRASHTLSGEIVPRSRSVTLSGNGLGMAYLRCMT